MVCAQRQWRSTEYNYKKEVFAADGGFRQGQKRQFSAGPCALFAERVVSCKQGSCCW